MAWIKSIYGKDINQLDTSKVYLTTITFISTIGRYNLFKMNNGDKYIVVFSDQKELLDYMMENEGCVFALRFLKQDNNKYEYTLLIPDGAITAQTVAAALVMMSTADKDRTLTSYLGGLIVIE